MPPKNTPPSPADLPPIALFLRQMSVAAQLHQTRMAQLLGQHDLTVAQLGVLSHLANVAAPGQSLARVAEAVEVNQPAVTKMVQKFDRMGWLARDENAPRRGRMLRLSPAGYQVLGMVQGAMAPQFRGALEGLSDADIRRLTQGLAEYTRWLDENRL